MNKIILISLFLFSLVIFSYDVKALDCNSGTCYCNKDGSSCALLRNPRGEYTVHSDITKCGCPPTVIEEQDELSFCNKTSPIWQFVGYGLLALKIAIPLLIIILGTINFAKAMLSSDGDATSKAAMKLLKSFIVGVIIFIIPTLVDVVFNLIAKSPSSANIDACQTCLLHPLDSSCDTYVSQVAKED